MKQLNPCIYIGLGSNLGHRRQNLEKALKAMAQSGLVILKTSPVYESPALLPPHAPTEWNKDFLNMVCEVSITSSKFNQKQSALGPETLLKTLKTIEQKIGRKKGPRWSPRVIDLDILLFQNQIVNTSSLKIPHPAITKRNFVLAPLKDINPLLKIPAPSYSLINLSYVHTSKTNYLAKYKNTALFYFRALNQACFSFPSFMQIVNLTPDSFSDGGKINLKNFKALLKKTSKKPVAFLDLGAESTRPNAVLLTPEEDWQRLKPYIKFFKEFYEDKRLKPYLSIDTRHPQTAQKAVDLGADIINDVSGLSLSMLKVIEQTKVDYVLTHSVTVPASREHTLPLDKDPVEEIKHWLEQKITLLEKHNIDFKRVIFDPGIGFGKTAEQSLVILKRIREFHVFPFRIMVGHSRKSFMQNFAPAFPEQRDLESVGVSLRLALAGVDILRVHEAELHARAFRGFTLGQ